MSMGDRDGGEREQLAPVIPLFGGAAPTNPPGDARERPWHASWIEDERAVDDEGRDATLDGDGDGDREAAEQSLLKRLRTRQLSVAEARTVLREHDLPPDAIESVLEGFGRLGYLDDASLAEQLIHTGAERKGQGRRVIAQTMTKRGIPRDVAEAVLAELPDDDDDRALEFARTKARSMTGLDRETALRRLTGQLARRGYGGSIAMSAARTALDEVQKPSSGVRFR